MNNLKLGIIGCGRIGQVHIKSIIKTAIGAEIAILADPFIDEDKTAWAKKLGINKVTKDPSEIFESPEIDAVLICSSTDTHTEYTTKAALAGKHVFCEKPLDHDIDRIKETLKVIEKSGVQFQIGFNRRFDHNFMAVKNAVESGKIGEQHIIRITSRDPQPPDLAYIKVSGGIFMDMTIHDFDMLRYLSGCEAEEIYAKGAVLIDPEIGKTGDIDTAVITLKMANGAIAIIENSRKAAYGYDQRAEVFGSGGSVITANDTPSNAVISTADGVTSEKPLFFFLERYMDSFSLEIKEFVNSIKNRSAVKVGAIDALRSVQMAMAANESLKTGLPVKIKF